MSRQPRLGVPENSNSSLLQDGPRKVLVSPGFGAGWSTWNAGKFAAEYKPIINFLESGGVFVEKPYGSYDRDSPCYEGFEEPGRSVLKQFVHDCNAHEGSDDPDGYVCLLGADDLVVCEVHGPYRIDEYDGSESLVAASQEVWW